MKYIKGKCQPVVVVAIFVVIPFSSAWAEKNTVTTHACSKANLTRYVHLREESNGAPCDVLYIKPDESSSVGIPWSANNEAGFCRSKYKEFISKLSVEFGWQCSELRDENVKGPPTSAASTQEVDRKINSRGHVVLRYSDGSVVTIGDGSRSTSYADGSGSSESSSQAPSLFPPPAPISSEHTAWLNGLSDSLLFSIKKLVDFDDRSVNMYLRTERTSNPYEKVSRRMHIINRLLD